MTGPIESPDADPSMPELRQIWDLRLPDFERHPLWIGVHNFDIDEPWYDKADDQTYRPWTGPLPFSERRGIVLVRAEFELNDGSIFPGCFHPVRDNWDEPLPPRRMRDGNYTKPLQWSARRGGSPLSVLSLHLPAIFINGQAFGFHLLRRPEMRKEHIQSFYAALRKSPSDVFPVRFEATPGLFTGVTSGRMEGFYTFPLDKPFEIDTGESLL